MNGQTPALSSDVAMKIARLVEERGWNQEDFARLAKLNRQTVRNILRQEQRRLRNATVSACAAALGVPVGDLRNLPLERLFLKMKDKLPGGCEERLRHLYEQASQPELQAWLDRNGERAKQLDSEELDELLSLQGVGGPLTSFGVDHFVAQLERRRQLLHKVRTVASTELVEFLEKFVDLLYDKVQLYSDRK